MATSIVLADDEVLLREGLAGLLDSRGFDVIGQAGDGADLVRLVLELRPDLVITDIRMPPSYATEGLDAAQTIRSELPRTGVVVLSAHVEVEHAIDLIAEGTGIGYLLKSRISEVDEFIDAVERVAGGGSVVDPGVIQELVSARTRADPLGVLSEREREVLGLMAQGYSNLGISRRVFIAEGTVEKHVKNILMKLDLPAADEDHRRVLAVIRFLDARSTA